MTPGRYRKKPVEIDAMEWDGSPESFESIRAEFGRDVAALIPLNGMRGPPFDMLIRTLEGRLMARPGDFIIRGIKGELYPCKPDIFAATYEEVSS